MKYKAKIIRGYGTASGKNGDPRYPDGTLAMQKKHFRERGLDLSAYFSGTINLDIAPFTFKIKKPKYFFQHINWSPYISPENFYFFDVNLFFKDKKYTGLIYMPDPETKEEHMQGATTLELILPKIEGIHYDLWVYIETRDEQIEIFTP